VCAKGSKSEQSQIYLRKANKKHATTMADESESFPTWVIVVLVVLTLILLGAAVYFWWRRTQCERVVAKHEQTETTYAAPGGGQLYSDSEDEQESVDSQNGDSQRRVVLNMSKHDRDNLYRKRKALQARRETNGSFSFD
jgi:flagellar basal body-associated protein FliL